MVSLPNPPEYTASVPPWLTVVLTAGTTWEDVFERAAAEGDVTGRHPKASGAQTGPVDHDAGREDLTARQHVCGDENPPGSTTRDPPLSTVVLKVWPPSFTNSIPSLPTVVKSAWPPADKTWTPPLLTVVLMAEPKLWTYSMPPLLTVANLAVPPYDRTCAPPLLTVVLRAPPPDDTVSEPPLLTVVPTAVPPRITYRRHHR